MNNILKNNKIIILSNVSTTFIVAIFIAFFFIPFASAKEINLKNTVYLVNQSRSSNGLNKLYINPILLKVAKNKASDMITNHYFAHTSPDGITPWYWFKKNNYDYRYAGENLAINYTTVEEQHQAWMNSPTHRKNILNPNYTEIGIATASGYIDKKPAFVTVQVFGKPQTTKTAALITSTNYPVIKNPSLVLGTQLNYQQQVSYLKKNSTPNTFHNKNITNNKNFSFLNSKIFLLIKSHTRDLLWLTILILGIIITRDLVLNTINSPTFQRHSTTNLILLLMLWSILIGI